MTCDGIFCQLVAGFTALSASWCCLVGIGVLLDLRLVMDKWMLRPEIRCLWTNFKCHATCTTTMFPKWIVHEGYRVPRDSQD